MGFYRMWSTCVMTKTFDSENYKYARIGTAIEFLKS